MPSGSGTGTPSVTSNNDIINRVKKALGGSRVAIETAEIDYPSLLRDTMTKIEPWQEEIKVVTLPKVGTSGGSSSGSVTGYLDVSGLTDYRYPVEVVPANGPTLFDVTSSILDLPANIVWPESVIEHANWMQLKPALQLVLNSKFRWRAFGTSKILLSGSSVNLDQYSVFYAIKLNDDMTRVTNPKTINWIIEYMEASVELTVGRIRRKYQQGGLNFQLDGDAMVSGAETRIQKLEDQLKTFSYSFRSAR